MDTNAIVQDLIGTLTRYGINADQGNISQAVMVVLETRKELEERLKAIRGLSHTENWFEIERENGKSMTVFIVND